MRELPGGLGFALKAKDGFRRQPEAPRDDLERHLPVEGELACFVDDAHTATTELTEDLKVSEAFLDVFVVRHYLPTRYPSLTSPTRSIRSFRPPKRRESAAYFHLLDK